MRTTDEIAAWYAAKSEDDLLGFTAEAVMEYLSFEQLKPFLKKDSSLEEWEPTPLTEESLLERMREYMGIAWEKALGHRGISAGRSVEKMRAWLWILGDDELVAFADDDENYAQYGVPILKRICERYGFSVPAGEWSVQCTERMAQGLPCTPACDEGCGC